jgi:hypothetical protein
MVCFTNIIVNKLHKCDDEYHYTTTTTTTTTTTSSSSNSSSNGGGGGGMYKYNWEKFKLLDPATFYTLSQQVNSIQLSSIVGLIVTLTT